MSSHTTNTIELSAGASKSFSLKETLQSPAFLKGLAIALGVILIVGGIAAGISTVQKNKDMELQEVYFGLESQILKIQEDLDKDKKAYNKEAFGNLIDKLSEFVKSNPSALAGQMGALLLSNLYTKLGEGQLAYDILSSIKPVGEIGAMAQFRLLNLLSDLGKHEEVVSLSDSLLKKDSSKIFHPEIRFAKALSLAELGQKEAAISELQTIVDTKLTEGSQIIQRAKKQIRLLKMESL
jgi:tetratricopeptide (TPR) repeat protein